MLSLPLLFFLFFFRAGVLDGQKGQRWFFLVEIDLLTLALGLDKNADGLLAGLHHGIVHGFVIGVIAQCHHLGSILTNMHCKCNAYF